MEKYTLDGANAFTLMKQKTISVKDTHMNDVITVIIKQCCDDFQVNRYIKCMGEWEAAKNQGLIRLQTSLGLRYL